MCQSNSTTFMLSYYLVMQNFNIWTSSQAAKCQIIPQIIPQIILKDSKNV